MSGQRKSTKSARQRSGAPTDQLVFLPLGGAGEIGMNLYLYGFGPERNRQWVIVDIGVTFADFRDPGIDLILPDTSFIEQHCGNLLGIVLTHAHEDHLGALAHLWPRLRAPVFATPFTAALLRYKLEETGLGSEVPVTEVRLGGQISLGPFDISLVSMTHSIPESNSLIIRTPLGNLMHSGDWRVDPDPVVPPNLDEGALRAFGEEGCMALICDSTNVLSEGMSPSETEIEQGLYDVISQARGRVAVTTFASNFGRLLSVGRAARRTGRHLCLVGRSMHRIVSVARETGYIDDFPLVLAESDFADIPPDKVLCLCTGSQGERRAALSRIASGNHGDVALDAGDLVIFSSRTIPGNEKEVSEVQNNLATLGVEIVTGAERPVHVTGHPRRGDLRQLYDWVKPDILIPMHGEMRHMSAHVRLAKECGIETAVLARNGDMVQIAPGPPVIIDEVPTGRYHLDGKLLLRASDDPVRIRRKISFAGALSVTLVLNEKGDLAADPAITPFGLPEFDRDGTSIALAIYDLIDEALEGMPRRRKDDDSECAETVRRALVRGLSALWGKRPLCVVKIIRL